MNATAAATETYRDLLRKLALQGRLGSAESEKLCQAAFEIGRADKIENDLLGVRRTLEVHAQHEADVETAEHERRVHALTVSANQAVAGRAECEKSLWEITEHRNALRIELRDVRQKLQVTETAKKNAQQEARSSIRRIERMQETAEELKASVEGQRAVVRRTEEEFEALSAERDRVARELAEAREQSARADRLRAALEAQAIRRDEQLKRRKASIKKTIRYMRGRQAVLARRVQELTCDNARLQDEKSVMAREISVLRDADRRMDRTLEQSQKVFANVSAVLSEAGAKFVRAALAAELQRADAADGHDSSTMPVSAKHLQAVG